MTGTEILHYRFDRRIGCGGMGEVYLATDLRLDRPVAIKVLPPAPQDSALSRHQLLDEARAASRLSHPNILTIYAAEEAEGRDFIVMEYVDGHTLREEMAAGPLSLEQALNAGIQVAEGLHAAHHKNLVHRDIKPDNVLITSDGDAKIMDFGLAIAGGRGSADAEKFAGTMAYASPEQIRGLPIGPASDLWSLGVVLYEMLTGRCPFEGEHAAAFAFAIVNDEPAPVSQVNPEVPAGVSEIVHTCLRKDPGERPETAADLAGMLRDALRLIRGRSGDNLPSIAVLPFANLSSDPEQGYFCEGIAEEIINALAHVHGLRVAARISSFSLPAQAMDAREIGRQLGVSTLLEGSVRKTATRLRVTAQLINVQDGFHIWSERYERPVSDVFSIQDEITQNVVRSLEIVLTDSERRALSVVRTGNIRAYDMYLRGRQFFRRRTRKSIQFARELFTHAIEADPGYADAHAGLADCWSMLIHFYGETGDASLEAADRESQRALELAPGLAVAHAARGLALSLKGRLDESDREFETATRLDPSLFDAFYLHGRACFQRGDPERAALLYQHACDVADDHEAAFFLAQTLTALGRHDQAQEAYSRAAESAVRYIELNPDDARAFTMGAVALCRTGNRAGGLRLAERAMEIDPADANVAYNVACFFALEGERERALTCLEQAVAAGFAHGAWVERDPDLESVRNEPRFRALTWRK